MAAQSYLLDLASGLNKIPDLVIERLDLAAGLIVYRVPGRRTSIRARWSKKGDRLLINEREERRI
jgi:hypothetical protein